MDMEFLFWISALGMVITLVSLAVIDNRIRILPDELNLLFLICALGFHISLNFQVLSFFSLLIGGLVALITMISIYFAAQYYYGRDALGLGDVKLLSVAGILLGAEHFMFALSVGASFGMLHGVALAYGQYRRAGVWPDMGKLQMPAGPGFIAGIMMTLIYVFYPAFEAKALALWGGQP